MTSAEPERIPLSGRLLKDVFFESLKGKSLARTLLNFSLRDYEISGQVIDLGSKTSATSYHRFLRRKVPCEILYTDLYSDGGGVQRLDLEKTFDLAAETHDFVLCFFTLEHVYDFANVVSESHRVLRKGGRFIGSVPFLVRFHPDPDDFFRFSHSAIERIFTEHGFVRRRLVYLGFGPVTVSGEQITPLIPKFLSPVARYLEIGLDAGLAKLSPYFRGQDALAYLFEFEKLESVGTSRGKNG
jgi:SAM-dependent methyltransferase